MIGLRGGYLGDSHYSFNLNLFSVTILTVHQKDSDGMIFQITKKMQLSMGFQ